jgi:lipoate-protein ligase B
MEQLKIRNTNSGTCLCVELPALDYSKVWSLQHNLVTSKRKKFIGADVILFLEHSPVFTLGRRGGMENLMVSATLLEKSGIPLMRGGDITFHGPGQLVVYPIIDLRRFGVSVADYVAGLEEVMIRVAVDLGIMAERSPVNKGVWVGAKKLGSIGIALRHGICYHGFAFNVNLSLKPFGWIQPCGLPDIEMTSIERELSHKVSMTDVSEAIKCHIEAVFGIDLKVIDFNELQHLLKRGCDVSASETESGGQETPLAQA